MIESIYIGMSGLAGYSRGLRVIANNAANLNTPGFKSTSLQFADMFYAGGPGWNTGFGSLGGQFGFGLTTTTSTLNFKQGELRQTGNDFDLAVDGDGMFVLTGDDGQVSYTRAGQFEFDKDGKLVNRADGARVMARGAAGTLSEVDIAALRVSEPSATKRVVFTGNLSSSEADKTLNGIKVIDATGAEHQLSIVFTNQSAEAPGRWKLVVSEGTTEVGSTTIDFDDGKPVAASAQPTISFTPKDQEAMTLTLDFSGQVTSFASGTLSTLTVSSQDGYAAGALTKLSFDDKGVLKIEYANGQKADGPTLALARFASPELLLAVGGNAFQAAEGVTADRGVPGEGAFGALRSGTVEISNVNLSQEFSDLVIMQRGYQASSQVIATANEMIQELFGIRGK